MSGVEIRRVAEADAEVRLDRWFKRHFPNLGHGRLEKLLRTGQIRLDGKRVDAATRVQAGQEVRVPPLGEAPDPAMPRAPRPPTKVELALIARLKAAVILKDADILALNKPPGLAVQGGTGTARHLDGLLDHLRFEADERPRLVHRLDRDTSGVLVLARNARAAARLAALFNGRDLEKRYWAIVVGVPKPREGRIDAALAKHAGPTGRERVAKDADGKRAITNYRTLDAVTKRAALLELDPLTGRTHQLRVHCAILGTPILGDLKYGAAAATLPGAEVAKALHLHARRLVIPGKGGPLTLVAEPPEHFRESMRWLGLNAE
jgi:23S rRNA pseudouridine955/2504/2580 synthase